MPANRGIKTKVTVLKNEIEALAVLATSQALLYIPRQPPRNRSLGKEVVNFGNQFSN